MTDLSGLLDVAFNEIVTERGFLLPVASYSDVWKNVFGSATNYLKEDSVIEALNDDDLYDHTRTQWSHEGTTSQIDQQRPTQTLQAPLVFIRDPVIVQGNYDNEYGSPASDPELSNRVVKVDALEAQYFFPRDYKIIQKKFEEIIETFSTQKSPRILALVLILTLSITLYPITMKE